MKIVLIFFFFLKKKVYTMYTKQPKNGHEKTKTNNGTLRRA